MPVTEKMSCQIRPRALRFWAKDAIRRIARLRKYENDQDHSIWQEFQIRKSVFVDIPHEGEGLSWLELTPAGESLRGVWAQRLKVW